MEEKIIKISDLSKIFDVKKDPALQSINTQISSGKIIGLIGPDGAGKTTLIRLMVGLLLPNSGSIQILGFDTVKEVEKIYPLISYMPQRFGLYEDLTVEQNLDLYAELYSLEKDEKKATFETLLHFTNLKPFMVG